MEAVATTNHNHRLVLNVAFNYGGRDELVHAIQQMIRDGVPAPQVTPELVSQYLYTAGVPDPDLIIRTSGELRISNFLIWQAAYSEWYVTPIFWPDFGKDELYKALSAYAQRDRRYGKVDSKNYEETHA
jgi:undecaprenyl diphosphate synthase